jgi:hypothetical protein
MKTGWQTLSQKLKPPEAQPLTVMPGSRVKRLVAPTRFKKIGVPTMQHLAALRGTRWYACVISTWSLRGEELGRERRELARSFATSAEANTAAERLRSKMERAEVDQDTVRTVGLIRRAVEQARRQDAKNRIFAANGRAVLNGASR